MKTVYAKCILYAYANLESILEQIDSLVEKKALASMDDFSPCIEQCEKVLALTEQKDVIIDLKLKCDKILTKFTDEEKDCLDYRYFKQKPKEYFIDFDFVSRAYFRRQLKVLDKVAKLLEKSGLTDSEFENTVLKIDFFAELLKRVKMQEQSQSRKKSFVNGDRKTSLAYKVNQSLKKSTIPKDNRNEQKITKIYS